MPDPVVVLIEDEPQIRRFLRATLTGQGYRLFEAGTGADGLVEIGSRQPDVVIIDLGLPDIDGLEVIRRMREWSDAPIIVLSARGSAPASCWLGSGSPSATPRAPPTRRTTRRSRSAISRWIYCAVAWGW